MTTHPLTLREAECLAVIECALDEGSAVPSYEELRVALGLGSRSGVSRLIGQLCAKGRIQHEAGARRSITVLQPLAPSDFAEAVTRPELASRLRAFAQRLEAA